MSPTLTPLLRGPGRPFRLASFGQTNLLLISVDPAVLMEVLHHRVTKDMRRFGADTRAGIVQRQLAKRGK